MQQLRKRRQQVGIADGKGIDPKAVIAGGRTGHRGLTEVRERAERIGGRLQIWRQTGAGTEVELSIPGSIAYETATDGGWQFAHCSGKGRTHEYWQNERYSNSHCG